MYHYRWKLHSHLLEEVVVEEEEVEGIRKHEAVPGPTPETPRLRARTTDPDPIAPDFLSTESCSTSPRASPLSVFSLAPPPPTPSSPAVPTPRATASWLDPVPPPTLSFLSPCLPLFLGHTTALHLSALLLLLSSSFSSFFSFRRPHHHHHHHHRRLLSLLLSSFRDDRYCYYFLLGMMMMVAVVVTLLHF